MSAVIPSNMQQQAPASPTVPALGRFGPIAVSVAAVAAVSMGLIAWSHMGWHKLQQRAHVFDTLLSEAQFQTRQSQWLAEQRVLGQADISDVMVDQPAAKAQSTVRQLHDLAPPALDPALQHLLSKIDQTRQALTKRLRTPASLDAAGLQHMLTEVDEATRIAAQSWATELDKETQAQHRLDKINMGLVGGMTLLLLTLMARAHRQREQATDALKAREAQLRAFAEVLPDLAFRMDAHGHYLDIYGSNLPLLGRPREAMLGLNLKDFFPADMSARFMGVLQQALQSRVSQSLTFSIPVNRERKHFDSRCAPIGDTNEVVWMIWDITSRRQIEHRLRRKTRMYDFLSHVNQTIVRSEDVDTLLEKVCEVAVDHGQFRKAWVAMFDEDDRRHLSCVALAGDAAPAEASLSFDLLPSETTDATLDMALRHGRTFRTRDLGQCAMRPAWTDEAIAAGIPGCVIVPLHRDNLLVGHLILLGKRVDDHDTDELSLFEDLSSDLSFALHNLHREALRDEAEERIRLHAAALESTQDGMMVLGRNRMVVSINPAFTALTGYDELEVVGKSPEFLLPDRPDETLADMRAEMIGSGYWQGEVWFRRKTGELFMTKLSVSAVKSNRGRPTHFVGVFTDITQIKQTEERLAKMAHFDPLTELPNRVMIHQRLAHAVNLAQRHHTLVGVIFIDLDNFKTVNDGLGHAAGDSLLKQVAQRLRQRVRQEDTLGRLGGDEFILVLEHLRHPQQAAHVATAILDTLNQPFTLDGGQQVYVRASIGISLFPADGQDAPELVRNADAAMYESKRRGRNSFSFYTEAFTSDATSRLQLETRLRRAVEHGEFVLHYQPMINLETRRVTAVEALVRLKAPTESDVCLPSVSPNQFIPVMEETGMIVALSEWVLQEACRQGKAWLDAGLDFGRIAVNLSPSEIRRGGVVERLSRILNRTGLPPDRLEIEITESGLMESGMGAEQFLQMLHALGVFLSIDDFGTGYSSLAYLKRFPVHQLKIDRSFVQDLPGNDSDAQLVGTMISMAHGLRMNVVAEGVEMPDQEAFLASRGCDVVQGYLYSRPVPAVQIEHMLENVNGKQK
ncbi:MAG: EAL domain-containing protein [Aquabacterium sp.]|uniref:GGDEF and EAL domain-containing protein n=1 Tax=Aquabacterium sp. TaxID=1872578 RepID=UPI0025BF69A4|nr:GGDEF and EAL domain-containing protein [Aquabacterium sp.]MBI5927354.1 EAL domain-containing protein [Aquabacterium sp.]